MFAKNFAQIDKLLSSFENIVIFHHIRPDGDCLGAQFGLKHLIEDNYENKKVWAVGCSYNIHNFLEFPHAPLPEKSITTKALAIIVDVSDLERIEEGEFLKTANFKHILRIDHHINKDFLPGEVSRWVVPEFSACCEQITELARGLNWKISPKAATYLYLGLATDSNRFLYASVTANTLELGKLLWESGAKKDLIHSELQKKQLQELKILSYIMQNYQIQGETIYFFMSLEIQKKFNILSPDKASRANVLGNVEGFPIWAFFVEESSESIRCDFRSVAKVSVFEVAKKFGGGGHKNASGAKIKSIFEISQVLEACNQQIAKDFH